MAIYRNLFRNAVQRWDCYSQKGHKNADQTLGNFDHLYHQSSAIKGTWRSVMRSKFFLLLLATFLVTALGGVVAVSASNESKYQARQHGYEHGYRDGFQHGREDQERRAAFKFDTDDYKHADRGYDKYLGNRDQYKDGYRTGYQAGYNDAYYRRPGRFSSIYRPSGDFH